MLTVVQTPHPGAGECANPTPTTAHMGADTAEPEQSMMRSSRTGR